MPEQRRWAGPMAEDGARCSGEAAGVGKGGEIERVLCVRRSELPVDWLPRAANVGLTWDEMERGLSGVQPLLRPRPQIEADPAFKQWVPYGLLCRTDGRVGCYRRQGDEQRLHGLLSAGVGGHVNAMDVVRPGWDWRGTLSRGLLREVHEEVPCIHVLREPVCLGLVNEEVSAVGRVHIGLVCRVQVTVELGAGRGGEVGEVVWAEPDRLLRDAAKLRLELWSVLALGLLNAPTARGPRTDA